jgi:hypothetical protein
VKLNPSLLLAVAISLCANSALAQGTMLYTWHDPHNVFQATFEIHDFEQASDTYFSGTRLFDQTFSVASPDHTWVGAAEYSSRFIGSSLYLDAVCIDPTFLNAKVVATGASLTEFAMSGGLITGVLFSESGFWSFAPVPEPSCVTLLTVGLLALYSKRAISRN